MNFLVLTNQIHVNSKSTLPLRTEMKSLQDFHDTPSINYWPSFDQNPPPHTTTCPVLKNQNPNSIQRIHLPTQATFTEVSQGSSSLSSKDYNCPNEHKMENEKTSRRLHDKWKEEYDDLLKSVVIKYKADWKRIVRRMFTLTNLKVSLAFLKRRYRGITNQNTLLKRVKFSHQEDLIILNSMQLYGPDWQKISLHLPGRSSLMIKNRFYSQIRKNKNFVNLVEEAKCISLPESSEEPSLQESNDSNEYSPNSWSGTPKLKIFPDFEENDLHFILGANPSLEELNERITQ